MKLSIPKPCHENWNKMSPTEKGKFCGSCQKEVIDFTQMTKVEIKEFFMNKAFQSSCGRFENRQIESFNRAEIKPKRINSKPWWIAAATFFLFVNRGFSQGSPQSPKVKQKQVQTDSTKNKAPVAMEAPKPNNVDPGDDVIISDDLKLDSFIFIKGQVLDGFGDTLPFVSIVIENTNFGTVTDTNGNFKLIVPKEHRDSLTLKFTHIGHPILTARYFNVHCDTNIGLIKYFAHNTMLMGVFTTTVRELNSEPTPATLFRRLRMKMRNRE